MRSNAITTKWEIGVTARKASTIASVGLLLVLAEMCLAAGPLDEDFENIWSSLGQRTEAELTTLPAKGRAAFARTLIACSIFADMYSNPKYTSECETTSYEFLNQFSDSSSALSILLKRAIELTRAHNTQVELDFEQGRRGLAYNNPGKVYIGVLQKAYGDTIPKKF
jgi:hypothetical protein